MEILVEYRSLKNNSSWNISVGTRTRLDIKACRFLSWIIRLARILLVLSSESYWHIATSLK